MYISKGRLTVTRYPLGDALKGHLSYVSCPGDL